MSKNRIGILTGGGDCPGLNAVIRGVAKSAINQHNLEVIGFYDGFLGLMEGRFEVLTSEKVSGILTRGGTILGTSNRAHPFEHRVEEGGEAHTVDLSDRCMELYNDLGLSALICVGGDGTMTIGGRFTDKGMNVVGVPKTIDKDVVGTDTTFGFDSAFSMATDAIDKLHTTADAHHRVMIVEVMGRNAGWLALESAIAGGGDVVLIPEVEYDIEKVATAIRKRSRFGKRFSIVVVSEGSLPLGGAQTYQESDQSQRSRLGGCSRHVARGIEELTDIECRVTVLGHLQRGGTPTPFDRLLATRFAVKAVDMVVEGQFNHMVALQGSEMCAFPISEVGGRQRLVPLDSSLVKVAQRLGISFGAEI